MKFEPRPWEPWEVPATTDSPARPDRPATIRRWTIADAGRIVAEIAAERQRQVDVEGWSTSHDNSHDNGELALAAGCYALHAGMSDPAKTPPGWPWHVNWWKPKNRRRDLIRAAALIVAEIERLDRAGIKTTEGK